MAKILIIEDDALIARLYQKVFTFDGHEVELATNGEEGWQKAQTVKPTLVLLDIMMPKMNGLQVLEKIKADPNLKTVPVVMLTNLAGSHDAEKALSMGAVKYIIKSEYTPKQVSTMVTEILSAYTRHEVPKTVG